MKYINFRSILTWVITILCGVPSLSAHEQNGEYIEPGENCMGKELIEGCYYDGMYFRPAESEEYEYAAMICTFMAYRYYYYDENGEKDAYDINGGYYIGDLIVPSEMYGLYHIEGPYTVIAVADMYKNGLTSLYLPETIEWIRHTIEECRYLERVHLNNSLRVLNGVKNCPVLTDCPLPLELEEIGDGWMSGIAISETTLPESLRVIGDTCFCRLPNLTEITIPETLEKLGRGCFTECASLRSITLPSKPILSDDSFKECPAVREVSVYAQTPYEIPSGCMRGIDKAVCTLRVPEGCEEAYANAEGWREFGNIVGSLNTGITTAENETAEWRAFASHGQLVIDNTEGHEVSIHSLTGQHMGTVTAPGRNEVALPQGVYLVSSRDKAVKVRI